MQPRGSRSSAATFTTIPAPPSTFILRRTQPSRTTYSCAMVRRPAGRRGQSRSTAAPHSWRTSSWAPALTCSRARVMRAPGWPATTGLSTDAAAPGRLVHARGAVEVAMTTVFHRVGAYEILHQIGSGGMAAVFLATDTRTNRQVALKLVSIEDDKDGRQIIEAERLGTKLQEAFC